MTTSVSYWNISSRGSPSSHFNTQIVNIVNRWRQLIRIITKTIKLTQDKITTRCKNKRVPLKFNTNTQWLKIEVGCLDGNLSLFFRSPKPRQNQTYIIMHGTRNFWRYISIVKNSTFSDLSSNLIPEEVSWDIPI